jgi:hypothetical protein
VAEQLHAVIAEAPSAPDFIEPVVGWRLWLAVADGGYLWLESLLYPSRWSPKRQFDAACLQRRRYHRRPSPTPGHIAPETNCSCGIYAARDPRVLARYLDSAYVARLAVDRVLGRVQLWGKVVECEQGWRAAHAYPESLSVLELSATKRERRRSAAILAGLGDYGVPVEPVRRGSTQSTLAFLDQLRPAA